MVMGQSSSLLFQRPTTHMIPLAFRDTLCIASGDTHHQYATPSPSYHVSTGKNGGAVLMPSNPKPLTMIWSDIFAFAIIESTVEDINQGKESGTADATSIAFGGR